MRQSLMSFIKTLVVLFLLLANNAFGSEILLSKLKLNLPNNKNVDHFEIQNKSTTEPIAFQIKTYSWRQDEENIKLKDTLIETSDIVSHPVTLYLKPQEMKTIRLMRKKNSVGQFYRIIIKEIQIQDEQKTNNAIKVLVNTSLPIFTYENKKLDKDLLIQTSINNIDNKYYLTVKNNDTQHLIIRKINQKDESINLNQYVLPNKTFYYELKNIEQDILIETEENTITATK